MSKIVYLPVPGTTDPVLCLGCGKPIWARIRRTDDMIRYVTLRDTRTGEEFPLHQRKSCIRATLEGARAS